MLAAQGASLPMRHHPGTLRCKGSSSASFSLRKRCTSLNHPNAVKNRDLHPILGLQTKLQDIFSERAVVSCMFPEGLHSILALLSCRYKRTVQHQVSFWQDADRTAGSKCRERVSLCFGRKAGSSGIPSLQVAVLWPKLPFTNALQKDLTAFHADAGGGCAAKSVICAGAT